MVSKEETNQPNKSSDMAPERSELKWANQRRNSLHVVEALRGLKLMINNCRVASIVW
jgi:hypothetical protein